MRSVRNDFDCACCRLDTSEIEMAKTPEMPVAMRNFDLSTNFERNCAAQCLFVMRAWAKMVDQAIQQIAEYVQFQQH